MDVSIFVFTPFEFSVNDIFKYFIRTHKIVTLLEAYEWSQV